MILLTLLLLIIAGFLLRVVSFETALLVVLILVAFSLATGQVT